MADGDLHLSSQRVGIALQGKLQRCPEAAMELCPKGWRWRLGRDVVVVVWRKGGEEERGRGDPSGARPAAFREPFWCSSSAKGADLCQRSPVARERAPHHDHGERQGRLTTCQSCHSSVWNSLSLLLCVDLVCAGSTQKNHIQKNSKIVK